MQPTAAPVAAKAPPGGAAAVPAPAPAANPFAASTQSPAPALPQPAISPGAATNAKALAAGAAPTANPFATGGAPNAANPAGAQAPTAQAGIRPATAPSAVATASTTPGRSPEQSAPPPYRPGPNTTTTTLSDGTQKHFNPQTQVSVQTDPRGGVVRIEKPGLQASAFRSDGRAARIEQVRADGSRVVVERGYRDVRRVEVIRPGGVRVVTYGSAGFVERPYRQGYITRTYIVGGRPEVLVYRTSYYGGYPVRSYVPRVYYVPAYYGWAARPWAAPVTYVWVPRPWYGAYYVPERVYPSASFWIADFLLSENLRIAYEARTASLVAAANQVQSTADPVTLSPQVKQMIAEQVRLQIEADQQQANTRSVAANATPNPATAAASAPEPLPAALDPNYKVFVVHTDVQVMAADGRACTLTPGDVIQRSSATVSGNGRVSVVIMSSKNVECPALMQTDVELATLQDMHNQFRQHIAAGLEKLASTSGKEGIPAAPPANPQALAEGQGPADEQAVDLLSSQSRDADQAEEEVKLASASAV